MGRASVKMKNAGVRELLTSDEVRADLERRGERVRSAMADSAPVESGDLAASHTVEVDEHPDRVAVHVGSDLDYALHIALATGYMARALDAAGGA